MPLKPGQLLRSRSKDKSLAAYTAAIMQSLTTDALSDNTHGTYTKYDVGAWLGLAGGGSPGVLVVATTLPQGQWQKLDISSHGWVVQKYQWFWFRIVNGQRIQESSDAADAGNGRYYPEVSISRSPALLKGDSERNTDQAAVSAPTLTMETTSKRTKPNKR